MFVLSLYSKTLSAKTFVTGVGAKATIRLLGVMKVWRGASLRSVRRREDGNSRKILAL